MAEIDEYPHQALMKKAGLKIEDLDTDLQTVIKDFDERKRFAKNEGTMTKLSAHSALITQAIYDYYVDDEEQSVVINEEPTATQVDKIADEIKEEIKEDTTPIETPTGPTGDSAPVTPAPEQAESSGSDLGNETPTAPEQTPEPSKPDLTPVQLATGDEGVIESLYTQGKTTMVTRKELKAAGLNTGMFGKLGATGAYYGKYKVVATSPGSDIYNISLKQ